MSRFNAVIASRTTSGSGWPSTRCTWRSISAARSTACTPLRLSLPSMSCSRSSRSMRSTRKTAFGTWSRYSRTVERISAFDRPESEIVSPFPKSLVFPEVPESPEFIESPEFPAFVACAGTIPADTSARYRYTVFTRSAVSASACRSSASTANRGVASSRISAALSVWSLTTCSRANTSCTSGRSSRTACPTTSVVSPACSSASAYFGMVPLDRNSTATCGRLSFAPWSRSRAEGVCRAIACLAKRTTASTSWPNVANPSTPTVPSGASSILESAGTSTSRISELLRRLAGRRNGLVRLFAASSTMRELRRVTVNANGLLVASMPKSCCSIRNAPGLAPRHA